MSQVVASYQTAPFTVPQNGQPGDADQVRGNDNTVRAALNSHDGDAGVHFQSSTLASRPIAGTAGRKWYTNDEKRIYFDNGTSWDEVAYLPLAGGTVVGAFQINSTALISLSTSVGLSVTSSQASSGAVVVAASNAAGGIALQVNGSNVIKLEAARIGFFGAGAQLKPTVSGSKGANAALTSLLTALATLGLLTDSSS